MTTDKITAHITAVNALHHALGMRFHFFHNRKIRKVQDIILENRGSTLLKDEKDRELFIRAVDTNAAKVRRELAEGYHIYRSLVRVETLEYNCYIEMVPSDAKLNHHQGERSQAKRTFYIQVHAVS